MPDVCQALDHEVPVPAAPGKEAENPDAEIKSVRDGIVKEKKTYDDKPQTCE